ncbi:hypothetical protein [Aeromicrobium marinum]|nr:hypothetical protein [Aeromicrobium marinum]
MTADLQWLADLPGRCPACFLHEVQGHRARLDDGVTVTGCTNSGPVGVAAGTVARDLGIAATVEAHPDDAARVDEVLNRFIRSGKPFTANDTRPLLTGVKGSVIGGRFNAAARRGLMRRTGKRVPSTDPGTHAHRLDEWQGVAA